MDTGFHGLSGKCIVIYMDDLIVYSKDASTHTKNLRRVLKRCERYRISLNPKKCSFGITEGKLLGHVISENGISIDPDRIEGIKKLQLPNSKKELKSFFGKINFVRKFITGFAEIVQPLNAMLKKDAKIEWTPVAKAAFEDIKEAISNALMLTSPDYTKPFYIYSFVSSHSVVVALTQKGEDNEEKPIAFMSAPLKDAQLKYLNTER